MIDQGVLTSDPQQLKTIESFQRLHDELVWYTPGAAANFPATLKETPKSKGFWESIFSTDEDAKPIAPAVTAKPQSIPKGIYIYGGVGCG